MVDATVVTGTKYPQRGTRIKPLASTVDVTGFKTSKKNVATPGTRFWAFLNTFTGKAKRVATVEQMVDSCWAMQDALGMPRDPIEAILRDLANYISGWLNPTKTGSRGMHLNVIRIDGTSVSNTDLAAKYEFVSFKAGSSFAREAAVLGWPVA